MQHAIMFFTRIIVLKIIIGGELYLIMGVEWGGRNLIMGKCMAVFSYVYTRIHFHY